MDCETGRLSRRIRREHQLVQSGRLVAPVITFATNDLAIMVRAGNPARVGTLADLGRASLALAMPNPEFEGVRGRSGPPW
jgi:ABC-type sulfate transport system substrate-binding protein